MTPDTILAFASDRSGSWDIYRMNADGSKVRRLTDHPSPERNPSWSPDGTRIAFVRLANISDLIGDIYVMRADGSRPRFLTMGGTPKWSADGRRLTFHRYSSGSSGPLNGEIWVINADGTNERLVATDGLDPAFAPDGRHIVFGGINRRALLEDEHPITNVTAVALDGSGRRQVTNNPIYACQPAVSPDGSIIAYIGASPDGNTYHLALIDWLGRTAPVVLTNGLPRLESTPAWSPDGSLIAIGRDPDGDPHYAATFGILDAQPARSTIVLVGANGTGELVLSDPDANHSDADPSFRPRAP